MDEDVRQLLQRRKYDEALERLLDLYETKVFRMALSMLKDRARAEDVTQDVFLRLWLALPSCDGRATLSTWLYTIARNTSLSAVRAERYRQTTPLDEAPEPAAALTTTPQRVALEQQLSRLPEIQREVVTLFYLHCPRGAMRCQTSCISGAAPQR